MSVWISIKDRLPKKGKCVDVYHPEHGRLTNYSMEGTKKNRYFRAVKGGLTCVRDVTHWMLEPEAPKETK